jgi:DNA polymerase-3 subunit epsilon
MTNHRIAWVDVETTGLEADKHRVIEVAVEVTDMDLRVIEAYSTKIGLDARDRLIAEPKALEVNGYTDEEWQGAPMPSYELWERVHRLTSRLTLAGQNVEFDAKFMTAEMLRFGLRPSWIRRKLDVMGYGINAMMEHGLKSASLDEVYAALGGPNIGAHRAVADVKRAQYVYKMYALGYRLVREKLAAEGFVKRGELEVGAKPPTASVTA